MPKHTTITTETTTHHVTVEATDNNCVVIACPAFPGAVAIAASEQEAMSKLKAVVESKIRAGEKTQRRRGTRSR